MSNTRKATNEEMIEQHKFNIDHGFKVSYRHGVCEQSCSRAKSGVRHVEYTSAKPFVKNGQLHVKRRGVDTPLTGTMYTYGCGTTRIVDVREDCQYLPSKI